MFQAIQRSNEPDLEPLDYFRLPRRKIDPSPNPPIIFHQPKLSFDIRDHDDNILEEVLHISSAQTLDSDDRDIQFIENDERDIQFIENHDEDIQFIENHDKDIQFIENDVEENSKLYDLTDVPDQNISFWDRMKSCLSLLGANRGEVINPNNKSSTNLTTKMFPPSSTLDFIALEDTMPKPDISKKRKKDYAESQIGRTFQKQVLQQKEPVFQLNEKTRSICLYWILNYY